MESIGILVLFAVGFLVGKNWTKIRTFVETSAGKNKETKK